MFYKNNSLYSELEKELVELDKHIKHLQQESAHEHEISQPCDMMDINWTARIDLESSAEIRGAYRTARALVLADDVRLGNVTVSLAMNQRNPLLGYESKIPDEWEAKAVDRIEAICMPEINEISLEYGSLKQHLAKATDAIREGRALDLDFLLDDQRSKEQRNAKIQEKIDILRTRSQEENERDR